MKENCCFAWFKFSDYTWHGNFRTREKAVQASMRAQPNLSGGKTIAWNGLILGQKNLDSKSIVRFEIIDGVPVNKRIDIIHSNV